MNEAPQVTAAEVAKAPAHHAAEVMRRGSFQIVIHDVILVATKARMGTGHVSIGLTQHEIFFITMREIFGVVVVWRRDIQCVYCVLVPQNFTTKPSSPESI